MQPVALDPGVQAAVEGIRYAVGGTALLRELSATVPHFIAAPAVAGPGRGAAVLYLLRLEDGSWPRVLDSLKTRLRGHS
jgi:Cu2+-exporting ATPase